jgi:hypothetical protein
VGLVFLVGIRFLLVRCFIFFVALVSSRSGVFAFESAFLGLPFFVRFGVSLLRIYLGVLLGWWVVLWAEILNARPIAIRVPMRRRVIAHHWWHEPIIRWWGWRVHSHLLPRPTLMPFIANLGGILVLPFRFFLFLGFLRITSLRLSFLLVFFGWSLFLCKVRMRKVPIRRHLVRPWVVLRWRHVPIEPWEGIMPWPLWRWRHLPISYLPIRRPRWVVAIRRWPWVIPRVWILWVPSITSPDRFHFDALSFILANFLNSLDLDAELRGPSQLLIRSIRMLKDLYPLQSPILGFHLQKLITSLFLGIPLTQTILFRGALLFLNLKIALSLSLGSTQGSPHMNFLRQNLMSPASQRFLEAFIILKNHKTEPSCFIGLVIFDNVSLSQFSKLRKILFLLFIRQIFG